jgi:hypothetical protein
MPLTPPVLDNRALLDVLQQLRQLAATNVPEWKPASGGDAGTMLQRIFARLMELALSRLNGAPDKNLMAFLDTMGVSLIPPSAARVPLTFTLKSGSSATLVPKGAQAGTAPGGSLPAATYETDGDFTVIPARITQVFTMDPFWDRYTDSSAFADGRNAAGFTPFAGATRLPHVFNLGHDILLDFTTAVVDLEPAPPFAAGQLAALQTLFRSLEWRRLQGGVVQTLAPAATISTTLRSAAGLNAIRLQLVSTAAMTVGDKLAIGSVVVTIAAVEPGDTVRLSAPLQTPLASGAVVSVVLSTPLVRLPVGTAIGQTALQGPGLSSAVTGRWLQGALPFPVTDLRASEGTGLRNLALRVSADGLTPDLVFSDDTPLDVTKEALPFGVAPHEGSTMYIGSREIFSKPNVKAFLHVDVKSAPPPVLAWEYWNGRTWSHIQNAIVVKDGIRTRGPTIPGDKTAGFTLPGSIEIARPFDIGVGSINGQTGLWFRVRIEDGSYSGSPDIKKFELKANTTLAAPAAAKAGSITLADANFAGTGSILQIRDDTDTAREVALVVQEPGAGATSTVSLAPPLRNNHPAGAPVHQRGVSLPVAALRDAVKATNSILPNSFIVNTATGVSLGDVIMIDDPGRRELVVVTNVQPAFFNVLLPAATASPGLLPTAGLGGTRILTGGVFTGGVFSGGVLTGGVFTGGAVADPTVGNFLFPFLFGYTITGRDPLLFEHTADVPVRRVTGDYFSGFAGIDTIDFKTPFYPFGESPGPGDLFYFGVPTTFPSLIHIDVDLQMNSPNVALQWEFFGAEGWQRFDVESDATDDFVRSGDILIPPQTYLPAEVNSQSNHWLRVRIARGNYGLPADYVPVDPAEPTRGFTVKKGTANLNPPVIRSLTLGYEVRATPAVITQDGLAFADQTPAVPFNPIVPFRSVADASLGIYADPQPAFYIGFDAVSPGETASLYVAATPRAFSGSIIKEQSAAAAASALPPLAWQYFDGADWRNITVFDGTNNLTASGTLEFLTPDDIAALAKFDLSPRFWIRATSAANDPAETQSLQGVFFNTAPAQQALSVENQIVGSSSGLPGQSFRLKLNPLQPGEQVFVIEPEAPSGEELAAVLQLGGPNAAETRANAITGEPEVGVRWSETPNFLRSLPSSRHYTLDRTTGVIAFGDGAHGLIPPRGTNNITATYRAGGGQAGNLPAGAVAQLKTAMPGVASVSNPIAADGGADVETAIMVRDRGPQSLRHRDRALSAGDLEWLARQAAGTRVARAKCVPNVNRDLRFEPGWVTVLIIPSGTESVLTPGAELIREVADYLGARAFFGLAAGTPARINVIGPGYIQVALEATIVPRDVAHAEQVKRNVISAIAAFFHPLTGGPDGAGWEFARDVFESEIDQVLEGVEGVSHIKRLNLVPAIAQHLLQFSKPVNAEADLPEDIQVATPDLRKAASLAEALPPGPTGRAAVKGFKEGDRIAFALDLTVVSVSQQIITVAPFQSGGVGFPRGSAVARFDLGDQAALDSAIRRGQSGLNQVAIDSAAFASHLSTGDIITVFYPFAMTVRSVAMAANGTQSLGIDPYTVDGDLTAGSVVATLNNRARLPLAAGLPGKQQATSLTVQGFAPGDSVVLSRRDGTFKSVAAPVVSVSQVGSVVYLDDNFLPYPGRHRITMEGA